MYGNFISRYLLTHLYYKARLQNVGLYHFRDIRNLVRRHFVITSITPQFSFLEYYCIVYKPFNVLSQFTSGEGKQTLKNFFDVPADVYPVGRLDYDSEGLLVLTNDKKINRVGPTDRLARS